MIAHVEYPNVWTATYNSRCYPPDLLPRLQAVLADLADLDMAYRKSLEIIERSSYRAEIRNDLVRKLGIHHRQRRAQISRELKGLERCLSEQMRINLDPVISPSTQDSRLIVGGNDGSKSQRPSRRHLQR